MAEGEVAIRFSVQDAEAVRQALEKLGKDGQAALDKLNAGGAAQSPTGGLKAVSVASDQLKGSINGLAASAGPLGSVMVALGPTGLAVAAAFGAVASVFASVKERAGEFQKYATEVHDAGESTGLTTSQIQALTKALEDHGVASEQATSGLQKFASEQASAAQGSGGLYDQLKRISPAMAEAFASARTPAAALDVLAQAISKVDDQTGILLSKLAFGKGSGSFASAFKDIANTGGLQALQSELEKTGYIIDSSIIKKQADAATASANKAKETERNWNAAASKIYEAWKDAWGNDSWWGDLSKRAGALADTIVEKLRALDRLTGLDKGQALIPGAQGFNGNSGYTPMDPAAQAKEQSAADRLNAINDLTRANQLERERLGILGDTASSEEKIRAKNAEINQALMEGKNVSAAQAQLVKDNYANQVQAADIATRTSLGVATAEERRANTEERLNILVREGKITQDDQSTALSLYNKTLRETIENEQVRASTLPNLQRMQLDAANLNKTLDTFGTTTVNDVGNAFVAITSGTQSASDGFKNLEQAVLQSLSRMVYQMTIARVVAQGLNSVLGFFGGGSGGSGSIDTSQVQTLNLSASAMGNVFDRGRLMPFARGGIINRPSLFPMANGGTGLAGEAGPEAIMPLTRSADGRLGVSGGSQAPVVNVIIQNNSNEQASAGPAQQNGQGGLDIPVLIGQVVKDKMSRGEFDGVMGARFGARSGTMRR